MISKRPPTFLTRRGWRMPFARSEAVSAGRSPSAWRGWSGLGSMSSTGVSRPMVSPPGRASWSTKCVSCRMRMVSGRPRRRGLDTFDDLLTELVVLVGTARLRREREDRLPVCRALLEANALRDRRREDPAAEDFGHGLVHVTRQRRALVVQRDDGAEQLEVGVRAGADAVHGLQGVVGSPG